MMIKAKVFAIALVLSSTSLSSMAEPSVPEAGLLEIFGGSFGASGLNVLDKVPMIFDDVGVDFLAGGFGQLPFIGDLGGADIGMLGLDALPIDVAGVLGQGSSGEPAVMLPYNPLPPAITILGGLSFLDSLPGTEIIVIGLDALDAMPL